MSIEACGLTKRYGGKTAVDNLTFTVRPGMVTGFLGPNDAGKTTTMRLIVVLSIVGLPEVARKRSKGFSLGMSQRLGIAATLLGDPEIR